MFKNIWNPYGKMLLWKTHLYQVIAEKEHALDSNVGTVAEGV